MSGQEITGWTLLSLGLVLWAAGMSWVIADARPPWLVGYAGFSAAWTIALLALLTMAQVCQEITLDISGASL